MLVNNVFKRKPFVNGSRFIGWGREGGGGGSQATSLNLYKFYTSQHEI